MFSYNLIAVLVRRVVVSSQYNILVSSSWYDVYLCFEDLDEQSISG